MALVVQKFGGSSVANLDCIRRVTQIISRERKKGNDVVVVVSAMFGETDRLIDLARSAAENPHPREYDALLATGEQASAALLSMLLNASSCPAISYTGQQVGIYTDEQYRKATIQEVKTDILRNTLLQGQVPVVAGFQGVTMEGDITTIGRGGSDITAVAIAAALNADECQIFTDVEGVFTSDPRVVEKARLLEKITFEEMLELASLGAKVLQIRSVEFANKSNVRLRVLSSFKEGPGTLITSEELNTDKPQVSGIAFDRNQARISVLNITSDSSITSDILQALSDVKIEVDMMIQNIQSNNKQMDFSFTVHLDDYKEALRITQDMADTMKAGEVIHDKNIAKLSLVGVGMKAHASVAAKMIQVLSEAGIKIDLITSSEIKISTVIDQKYMELGARLLHDAFGLDTV